MKIKSLKMLWFTPGAGTGEHLITVGEDAVSITENQPCGAGDLWNWLVEWPGGSKTRYFRAFHGSSGVVSVHYGAETETTKEDTP